MAVEKRRGCGFRKVGGMYLVCSGGGIACDRLPFPLHVCPTCNQGIKQSRGWQWVNGEALFGSNHAKPPCRDNYVCVACNLTNHLQRAGLLWTGGKFYKSPDDFTREANEMGISRRIKAIPKGFELGKTWVLMAHPKAIYNFDVPTGEEFILDGQELIKDSYHPGIFTIFKPTAIEKIVTDEQIKDHKFIQEFADYAKKVGVPIKPVIVPANDRDHQGSVYDIDEEDENGADHA